MPRLGCPLLWAAFGAAGPSGSAAEDWSGKGVCGIGTNMLDHNEPAMDAFCGMGLAFWWNWNYVPKGRYMNPCAEEKFIPMFWGINKDDKYIAQATGKYRAVMGFNEPDHWGPPAYPGGDTLSAGTGAPFFHCGNPQLARHWQQIVEGARNANPGTTVISPAMADGGGAASVGDFSQCNSAQQTMASHVAECPGWLQCFKEQVINLPCGHTNCWDAIDVIQFHAYYYQPDDLISKVRMWEVAWAEDLQGLNGRSQKSLWITEFSHAGTTDPNDPDGAGSFFMEKSIGYMRSSPYVSGWSWFSQDKSSFRSFTINNIPAEALFWDSTLIDKAGQRTVLGQKYAELCNASPSVLVA